MKRVPAFIIGNGKHTIREIINKENRNPSR